MKFLADMRVSQTTVRVLCEHGREVISLREQQLGRLHDTDILDKAKSEGCVVLTFDLDFGDLLAATIQLLPSMVIFRLHNQPPPVGHNKVTRNHNKLPRRSIGSCGCHRGTHSVPSSSASNLKKTVRGLALDHLSFEN